ncbi:unnamed protein product [Heligmosomoides polygyrus]|uniref:Uncharacterized protein n=1 Tax=Heligmosomoides polygyrus TaxID=6339 RepID=A0A3P8AYN9_HELPZ|nr:unnamed protein product [Heligmosomoides polygyrus]
MRCKMCDSYISCANEMSEHCPPHTQCYTIRNQGTVTHKGCATNCAAIPYAISTSHCTTCSHRDNCNGTFQCLQDFAFCDANFLLL